jgi:hypothetical protein
MSLPKIHRSVPTDLQHGKILLARVGARDGRTAQVMKAGIER